MNLENNSLTSKRSIRKQSDKMDLPCQLEHYHLKNIYEKFFKNYIKKVIDTYVVLPPIEEIEVKGTTYAEYKNNELVTLNLEKHTTKFEIKNEDIKNADLITIRAEFFEKAFSIGQEKKQKIFKVIQDLPSKVSFDTDADLLTQYFYLLEKAKEMKAKGSEPILMFHPDLFNKIMRELEKPENKEIVEKKMKELKQ